MIYNLAPNPVFWTLQGEGALLGTPMAFVRLAGCSVGCPQCDTNYTFTEQVSVDDILARVQAVTPEAFRTRWVWITGGEPTDQDVQPLCQALTAQGYRVALATSGVRVLSPDLMRAVRWLSVSPHAPTFQQTHGHEVKLVPGLGGLQWTDIPQMRTGSFAWKFIQPLPTDTQRAVAFVLAHPGWQLSPQAHKAWRIP